jgi:hypothetical protein
VHTAHCISERMKVILDHFSSYPSYGNVSVFYIYHVRRSSDVASIDVYPLTSQKTISASSKGQRVK